MSATLRSRMLSRDAMCFVMSVAIGLVASELRLFCSLFLGLSKGEVADEQRKSDAEVSTRYSGSICDRHLQGRFSRFSDPC